MFFSCNFVYGQDNVDENKNAYLKENDISDIANEILIIATNTKDSIDNIEDIQKLSGNFNNILKYSQYINKKIKGFNSQIRNITQNELDQGYYFELYNKLNSILYKNNEVINTTNQILKLDKNFDKDELHRKINNIINYENDIMLDYSIISKKIEIEDLRKEHSNLTTMCIIIIIIMYVIYIIKSIFKKNSFKNWEFIVDFLKEIRKKDIETIYENINKITLSKIIPYFKYKVILDVSNIKCKYKNNYYTYSTYDVNNKGYNERINDKKIFSKFYFLLKELLIENINQNSYINYISMALSTILFLWATITLIFDTYSAYESIFGLPQIGLIKIKYLIISGAIIYIIVYVIILIIIALKKYGTQLKYIQMKQEVETILEILQQEITILEELLKIENKLEVLKIKIDEGKLEDYIKESLKIQKCEFEIQKQLNNEKLNEINKIYDDLSEKLK